jgi:hypothetical protein
MFNSKRIEELEKTVQKLVDRENNRVEGNFCEDCGGFFKASALQKVVNEVTHMFIGKNVHDTYYCNQHVKNYDRLIVSITGIASYFKTDVDCTEEVEKEIKTKQKKNELGL